MTLDPKDLSIREAAERGYPLDGSEALQLADALRATERQLERAQDERDSALLQVRLLQRQMHHLQALLSAWQEATREAVLGMDVDAPSPIPKLLMSMIAASSRASEENLAELRDTLAKFDEVVRLYDRKDSSHDEG